MEGELHDTWVLERYWTSGTSCTSRHTSGGQKRKETERRAEPRKTRSIVNRLGGKNPFRAPWTGSCSCPFSRIPHPEQERAGGSCFRFLSPGLYIAPLELIWKSPILPLKTPLSPIFTMVNTVLVTGAAGWLGGLVRTSSKLFSHLFTFFIARHRPP